KLSRREAAEAAGRVASFRWFDEPVPAHGLETGAVLVAFVGCFSEGAAEVARRVAFLRRLDDPVAAFRRLERRLAGAARCAPAERATRRGLGGFGLMVDEAVPAGGAPGRISGGEARTFRR